MDAVVPVDAAVQADVEDVPDSCDTQGGDRDDDRYDDTDGDTPYRHADVDVAALADAADAVVPGPVR
jgi:hypothetical protein